MVDHFATAAAGAWHTGSDRACLDSGEWCAEYWKPGRNARPGEMSISGGLEHASRVWRVMPSLPLATRQLNSSPCPGLPCACRATTPAPPWTRASTGLCLSRSSKGESCCRSVQPVERAMTCGEYAALAVFTGGGVHCGTTHATADSPVPCPRFGRSSKWLSSRQRLPITGGGSFLRAAVSPRPVLTPSRALTLMNLKNVPPSLNEWPNPSIMSNMLSPQPHSHTHVSTRSRERKSGRHVLPYPAPHSPIPPHTQGPSNRSPLTSSPRPRPALPTPNPKTTTPPTAAPASPRSSWTPRSEPAPWP